MAADLSSERQKQLITHRILQIRIHKNDKIAFGVLETRKQYPLATASSLPRTRKNACVNA
jgi:hypothetical protein